MYDDEDSDHLKLINFGFSKVWTPNTKMATNCGTLAYVAPEVLDRNYTSQCDLWSLGVTVFIMVFGYLPFFGYEDEQLTAIRAGKYHVKEEIWHKVSPEVREFVKALVVVDPERRLTATSALEHPWIKRRDTIQRSESFIDKEMAGTLVSFAAKTQFRRSAMHLMAWSLTNEERAQVRQAFIDIDTDRTGSITLNELKAVSEKHLHIDTEQAQRAFEALDSSHHGKIFYSEFLAAMVSARIMMHDHLLHATFQRFDADASGFITPEELKEALGDSSPPEQIEAIIKDLDTGHDGTINYSEFIAYFRDGNAKSERQEAVAKCLDEQIKQHTRSEDWGPKGAASEVQLQKMVTNTFPCCGLQ